MQAGTHPDFHLISRQSARFSEDAAIRRRVMQDMSIAVVREFIIAPVSRRAALGKGQVFIIREAELMSVPAQNALLKTLEEPPAGVTLILLCRSPKQLLATTCSRCALVRFGPLPTDFVTKRLSEDGGEPAGAGFWAHYADGSIGQGRRLAEMDLYAVKRELVERLAGLADVIDAELGEWLAGRAEALADSAVSADKQLARTLATRQGAGLLLGLIASIYQDALAVASGKSAPTIHADQAGEIERLAGNLAGGAVLAAEIITQLARYEQLLWRNVNPKTVWDNVLITCATGAPLDV